MTNLLASVKDAMNLLANLAVVALAVGFVITLVVLAFREIHKHEVR